jgi:hypothetical protein
VVVLWEQSLVPEIRLLQQKTIDKKLRSEAFSFVGDSILSPDQTNKLIDKQILKRGWRKDEESLDH